MSTTSSGVDLATKFQKLAAEYTKLRAQIPVLKKAVVDEQAKNTTLEDQLRAKDQLVRTLSSESESLTFRNQQLTKRVEFLQERLDETGSATTANSSPTKFFRKPSIKHNRLNQSMSHDHLSSSQIDDTAKRALEEELRRKLEENEKLNKQIFEIEFTHEKEMDVMKERINSLETEASTLRNDLSNIRGRQDAVLAELRSEKVDIENELNNVRMELAQCRRDCDSNLSARTRLTSEVSEAHRLISERILFNDQLHVDWNQLNVPSSQPDYGSESSQLFASLQPLVVQTLTHLGLFHSYCKQRAQLYPCDTNLGESMSEVNTRYCFLLRENANGCRSIESSFQSLAEKCRSESGFAEMAVDDFGPLLDACDNYKRFLADTLPLVRGALEEECATGWCNPRLADENRTFANAYEKFVSATIELVSSLRTVLDPTSSSQSMEERAMENLSSALDQLDKAVKGLCDQYSQKIIHEHQLPVATRQLRTTNECIAAALNSSSKYLGEFVKCFRDRRSTAFQCLNALLQRKKEWTAWRKQATDYFRTISEIPSDAESNGKANTPLRITSSASWHNMVFNGLGKDVYEIDWKTRLEEKEKAIGSLEREKEKWVLETQLLRMKLEQFQQQQTVQQRSDGKTRTPPNEDRLSMNASDDSAYVEEYYGNRVAELSSQLQDANSRIVFFQSECQNLLKTIQIYQKQKEKLQGDMKALTQQMAILKDELETTRKGYETQLSTLSEHLAQMNQKLTKQTDEIDMLRQAMNDKVHKKNRFK